MRPATPWIDWPIRALLLPVLAVQGLSVRRTARTLPEPPGPRHGKAPGAGAPTRLLILGDSSAAGVGCADQSTALALQLVAALAPNLSVDWRLVAQCGARTRDALSWLEQDTRSADIVVTVFGVNDVTKATPRARWHRDQSALFDRLSTMGARHIYATAVPPIGQMPILPNPLRWVLGRQALAFDATLQALCVAHPIARHVPFDFPMQPDQMAEDGYHPGPVIYAAWARHLAGIILADAGYSAASA